MDNVFVPDENYCQKRADLEDHLAASIMPGMELRGELLALPNSAGMQPEYLGSNTVWKAVGVLSVSSKKLADMQTEISISYQSCLQMGRMMDDGSCSPELISMLKRNSTGKAGIFAVMLATFTAEMGSPMNII